MEIREIGDADERLSRQEMMEIRDGDGGYKDEG